MILSKYIFTLLISILFTSIMLNNTSALTVEEIIKLKNAGVSDEVIKKMIQNEGTRDQERTLRSVKFNEEQFFDKIWIFGRKPRENLFGDFFIKLKKGGILEEASRFKYDNREYKTKYLYEPEGEFRECNKQQASWSYKDNKLIIIYKIKAVGRLYGCDFFMLEAHVELTPIEPDVFPATIRAFKNNTQVKAFDDHKTLMGIYNKLR